MIFDSRNKCHLNIEQQIKLLESRKLKINSYSKAKWYLDKYNYQSIVNGYNDPFMENFDRKMNLYLSDSSFESIIELFNYDRDISHIILNNIHNIERTLSHKISYVISEEMCIHKYNKGDILNIDEKIFRILFKPNVEINSFKESLTKYATKINDKLFKKYNKSNLNDIPIWTLCLSWTFGDLINIFKSLNANLQKKVISSYQNVSWNIDEFIKIMVALNKIRNRAAHNNVLYNVSLKLCKYMKPFFRKNSDLKIGFHSNTLALYDMVKIIDKISNKNKSNWSLMRIFIEKTNNKIKSSSIISDKSKEYIINIMNFN